MDTRVSALLALALGAAPGMAYADEISVTPDTAAPAAIARRLAVFNLSPTVRPEMIEAATLANRDALRSGDEPRRRRTKLRWICQPLEGGPQFEIGTFGSRKGVMKSRLLHVAMDWSF